MRKLSALIGLLSAVAAFPAFAENVDLAPAVNGDAQAVIASAFPQYAGDTSGAYKILSGLADLNSDNVAEMFVQIQGGGTCTSSRSGCKTYVLAFDGSQWNVLAERLAKTVGTGEAGQGGMRDIIFDDAEVWSWNGAAYAPDASKMGKAVQFSDATPDAAAVLASAFGADGARIGADVKLFVGKSAATGSAEDDVFAILQGDGICSDAGECPLKVFKNVNGSYVAVLDAMTAAGASVMPSSRDGAHDIIVSTPGGYSIYGWNGSVYSLAGSLNIGGEH